MQYNEIVKIVNQARNDAEKEIEKAKVEKGILNLEIQDKIVSFIDLIKNLHFEDLKAFDKADLSLFKRYNDLDYDKREKISELYKKFIKFDGFEYNDKMIGEQTFYDEFKKVLKDKVNNQNYNVFEYTRKVESLAYNDASEEDVENS